MRVEAIELPAYGPFTNASVNLREGSGKLEIIYGANEAGKSSLLRAISDFLFGIPGQTRDNFVHPYANLRIRATIERGGQRLECVRRKAATKSLRAADDDEVVSEEILRSFVPIEGRDVFQAMFGLDAERLQQGGEALLKGQSEFGQLLFSAAAGIAGLHDILKKLSEDAEKLFKTRSTTAALPRILDRLKESKDHLRQAQVSLTDWNRLQEEYQNARGEISRLESEILLKGTEAEKYKRVQISLALLAQHSDLREQLRSVEHAPILRDGFAADHQRTASDLIIKTREVEASASRVDELRSQIETIVLPDALLTREQEVLYLYQAAGAHTKAAIDRGRLQAEFRQTEVDMLQRLRTLGEPADLNRVPALIVQMADQRLVQEFSTSRARLETEAASSRESLTEERQKLASAREQLDKLPAGKPVNSLRTAVQNALLAGRSEAKVRSLTKSADDESRKINQDLQALGWPSTVEALENSDLPADDLVAEWMNRLDKAEQAVEQSRDSHRTAKAEVLRLENSLAALLGGRVVATPAQLAGERRRRDLGWTAVRGAWLEGALDSAAVREFLQQSPDGPLLAKAYEESVGKADDTADRLRADADLVAKLEQARIAVEAARKEAENREGELLEASASLERAQQEWSTLWAAFQVNAGAPRQMAAWLQRRATILARFKAVEEKKEQIAELLAEHDSAKRQLQERLVEIGETAKPSSDTLTGWRSLVEQIVQAQEELARQREKLKERISEGERSAATAELRVSNAEARLNRWKQDWAELMTRVGLVANTETSAAQEIVRGREQLQTLFQKAESHKARIAGIDRDETRFREQLHGLLQSLARDLLTIPEMEAVGTLHQRLTQAKRQQELRATKENDLERETKTVEKVKRERALIENRMSALAAEASCEVQLLPTGIEQSAKRKALEARLHEVEQQLAAIGGGRSLAELEAEASGVEPDQIPGQLELIDRQMKEARTQLKKAEERRVTVENELKRMEEASDACAASADIEAHKAEALEAAEQYIRLQIARFVLQGAIDRYREKSQGDMLKRSSELFALLTGSSFSRLKLDWDESNVVLVGVRALTGESIGIDGMSDGTRDQLYLALRLASVELYARDHEPIPFILDDILVRFDNDRAIAAIRALAELAKHTQVLLFTHHKHLLELATTSLPANSLYVAEIACRTGTGSHTSAA